jgi:trigger factor
MHQIEHLAEDSDRDPQEIVEVMHKNGSYALLQEEISRSQALDFLVENAVAVPMDEDEVGATQIENDEREEEQ